MDCKLFLWPGARLTPSVTRLTQLLCEQGPVLPQFANGVTEAPTIEATDPRRHHGDGEWRVLTRAGDHGAARAALRVVLSSGHSMAALWGGGGLPRA